MYQIYNQDNMLFETDKKFDLIYCDMIYENKDLKWMNKYYDMLNDNALFIIQTDFHTNYLVRFHAHDWLYNLEFVNHLVQKNEWGNHPKNKFHQCYDDIIIFCNGKNWKFYPERIQVDKVTKNKGLNPSGRTTKQATAWIDDICLTTTAKERVKKENGHLIRWQKPLKLFDRIIAPFTDEGDLILDPFMGSGSLGEWCIKNNREYIGIEYSEEVFSLAKQRLENCIQ